VEPDDLGMEKDRTEVEGMLTMSSRKMLSEILAACSV
jgi:hypothetical protein